MLRLLLRALLHEALIIQRVIQVAQRVGLLLPPAALLLLPLRSVPVSARNRPGHVLLCPCLHLPCPPSRRPTANTTWAGLLLRLQLFLWVRVMVLPSLTILLLPLLVLVRLVGCPRP